MPVHGQRISRSNKSSIIPDYKDYQKDSSSGRYFNVLLTNNDTAPNLLKLGPKTQIENNDTLSLGITYSCTDDENKYYDLNESSSLDDNCDCWYTLELIKPKDTIHFVIKLIGFDKLDTAKLFYSYSREIRPTDQEHYLNKDRSIFFLEKEKRNFHTRQILLNKHSPDNFVIELKTDIKKKSYPEQSITSFH